MRIDAAVMNPWWKRRPVILAAAMAMACLVGYVVVPWLQPTRTIRVLLDYSTVTNRIAGWHPGATSRGMPSDRQTVAPAPGTPFKRILFERGEVMFGPFTRIEVSPLGTSETRVDLRTTDTPLFGLLPERHVVAIEKQRWNEVLAILRER